jgi:transcriptional regulator with XRE-family HTH domain
MPECEKCWGTGKVIDHRKLGREMRQRRRQLGLSLKAAARYSGITPSFLCYLEGGKRAWTEEIYGKVNEAIT